MSNNTKLIPGKLYKIQYMYIRQAWDIIVNNTSLGNLDLKNNIVIFVAFVIPPKYAYKNYRFLIDGKIVDITPFKIDLFLEQFSELK